MTRKVAATSEPQSDVDEPRVGVPATQVFHIWPEHAHLVPSKKKRPPVNRWRVDAGERGYLGAVPCCSWTSMPAVRAERVAATSRD